MTKTYADAVISYAKIANASADRHENAFWTTVAMMDAGVTQVLGQRPPKMMDWRPFVLEDLSLDKPQRIREMEQFVTDIHYKHMQSDQYRTSIDKVDQSLLLNPGSMQVAKPIDKATEWLQGYLRPGISPNALDGFDEIDMGLKAAHHFGYSTNSFSEAITKVLSNFSKINYWNLVRDVTSLTNGHYQSLSEKNEKPKVKNEKDIDEVVERFGLKDRIDRALITPDDLLFLAREHDRKGVVSPQYLAQQAYGAMSGGVGRVGEITQTAGGIYIASGSVEAFQNVIDAELQRNQNLLHIPKEGEENPQDAHFRAMIEKTQGTIRTGKR